MTYMPLLLLWDHAVPPPVHCAFVPATTSAITALTTGWPATCAGVGVGQTCKAPCKSGFTGSGYQANCTAENTWGPIDGTCTSLGCLTPPMLPDPSLTVGYNDSCITNAQTGTTCKAPCIPTASGTGYLATCELNGGWSYVGSCRRKCAVLSVMDMQHSKDLVICGTVCKSAELQGS